MKKLDENAFKFDKEKLQQVDTTNYESFEELGLVFVGMGEYRRVWEAALCRNTHEISFPILQWQKVSKK